MRIHSFLPVLLVGLLGSACVRRARTEIVYIETGAPPTMVQPIAQPVGAGGSQPVFAGSVPSQAGAYVLVGYDNASDGYHGDTMTQAALPVLCLRASGLADPGGLPPPAETPFGSLRSQWSGAEIALTEPMAGQALTSRGVADAHCASRFGAGWRMAEFHDGGPGSGYDFWAYAVAGDFDASRFWVSISDQPANPWNSGRAMTWRTLARR